jgi:DNA-binding transcriptional ArsR family regulator
VTVPLEDHFPDLIAGHLRAIADPYRIRILTLLEQNEACVQQLADELHTTHANASSHLKVLHRAGIVSRRRQGSRAYYALADYTACLLVRQAIASIAGHVEELVEVAGLER